jgi:endonuclease/exonuclease/phosphatase family metal-dependent hydrolase
MKLMKYFFSTVLLACQVYICLPQSVKLMTYNLRFDNPADGVNNWNNRKAGLVSQLMFYEPDIFGTQEGLVHQLAYIDSFLIRYTYTGVGREDGISKGEHSAIFYDSVKFSLISGSTFWLSETPEKISVGWDAALERVCTCALFENKETGKRIWVFNTHFDHIGQEARSNSSRLIVSKINALNTENHPVILMGDFNLEPGSEPVEYLSEHFNDSRHAAIEVCFGPEGTFNAFRFDEPVTSRIDYIFTGKENIEVLKYAVLSDSKDCRYYSDHLPVFAEIIF